MGWFFSKGGQKGQAQPASWTDLYGNSFRDGYSVAPVNDDVDYIRPDDSYLSPEQEPARKRPAWFKWAEDDPVQESSHSSSSNNKEGMNKSTLGLIGAAAVSVLLAPLWCVFPCLAVPAVAGGGVAVYKANKAGQEYLKKRKD